MPSTNPSATATVPTDRAMTPRSHHLSVEVWGDTTCSVYRSVERGAIATAGLQYHAAASGSVGRRNADRRWPDGGHLHCQRLAHERHRHGLRITRNQVASHSITATVRTIFDAISSTRTDLALTAAHSAAKQVQQRYFWNRSVGHFHGPYSYHKGSLTRRFFMRLAAIVDRLERRHLV